MIQIEALTVGPFQSNCYIVSCGETADAIIVDAGAEAQRILESVERLGVKVRGVINTHAHLDHVSALADVREALGVPVWMHPDEVPIYKMIPMQAQMFGLDAPRTVAIDRFISDGEWFSVGNLRAQFLLTPGHSPGSVCLHFRDEHMPRLFAGDVLFHGSIGRTDLPGGDYGAIMRSLKETFVPLHDDTVVYPGHGPMTTIGEEKRMNPFLAPLAGM